MYLFPRELLARTTISQILSSVNVGKPRDVAVLHQGLMDVFTRLMCDDDVTPAKAEHHHYSCLRCIHVGTSAGGSQNIELHNGRVT